MKNHSSCLMILLILLLTGCIAKREPVIVNFEGEIVRKKVGN